MTQQDFFKQLKNELHDHPYRDRYLEELENHAEDLEIDMEVSGGELTKDIIREKFGTPKEIKNNFIYMMNTKLKAWILFLYVFSLMALFTVWSLLFNALLVPWDGTLPADRPAVGTWERSLNDFFEAGMGSAVLSWIVYALIGTSLLIVFLRMRKIGQHSLHRILDYAAITNFLYVGLFFALTFLYVFLAPQPEFNSKISFNLVAMIMHVMAIIALFYMQYTEFTIYKNKELPLQKQYS